MIQGQRTLKVNKRDRDVFKNILSEAGIPINKIYESTSKTFFKIPNYDDRTLNRKIKEGKGLLIQEYKIQQKPKEKVVVKIPEIRKTPKISLGTSVDAMNKIEERKMRMKAGIEAVQKYRQGYWEIPQAIVGAPPPEQISYAQETGMKPLHLRSAGYGLAEGIISAPIAVFDMPLFTAETILKPRKTIEGMRESIATARGSWNMVGMVMAGEIATKAVPKGGKIIKKIKEGKEITAKEATELKKSITESIPKEAKQLKEIVEISRPEILKQEIKWRLNDYKEANKMFRKGFEKEVIERYIEGKAKQAIKQIEKAEKKIKRDLVREEAIKEKLAKQSKRITEQAQKRQIKKEFRKSRLYEQPYEGEWGIESGLKTLRRGRIKKTEIRRLLEERARNQREIMRKRHFERQERRIRKQEREIIKNRKRTIKIKEDPRTREIRQEAERIVERTTRKRRPEIEIWKPKRETEIRGKEVGSGRQRLIQRTEKKIKTKQKSERIMKQARKVKTEQITKAEQRYAQMLAKEGKLKTVLIGKRAYAITPMSILAMQSEQREIQKRKEKEKIILIPMEISKEEITQKMKESIKELKDYNYKQRNYEIVSSRTETPEQRYNRIKWENIQKKREEKKKKGIKKGKQIIHSIDDPLYRLTGKAKYSDVMNIMMKKKYGGFYA